MTEEQYLIEAIQNLQREYEKAAKPYVDRLIKLRNMDPGPVLILPAAELPDSVMELLR